MSSTFQFTEDSIRISNEDFESGKYAYLLRQDKLYVTDNNGNKDVLRGLRFDADDIRSLLAPSNVQSLYLVFIQSPLDPRNLSIAATIIKSDAAYPEGVFDAASDKYDYCEPCPSRCPSNL